MEVDLTAAASACLLVGRTGTEPQKAAMRAAIGATDLVLEGAADACLALGSTGTLEQKAAVRDMIGAPAATVSEEVTIGPVYPGGGTATAAVLAFYNTGYQRAGKVRGFRIEVGTLGSGAFLISHFRETAPGVVTVVATYAATAGATGWQTFVAGTDFAVGIPITLLDTDYLGYQGVSGGMMPMYNNSGGGGYRVYTGTAAGAGVVFSLTVGGVTYYQVDLEVESPYPSIEYRQGTVQCPLEVVEDFVDGVPDGWLNETSGWTVAGGVATATATGKKLRTGKITGMLRRTVSWRFRLGATANVVSFFTDPLEGGISAGSMVKVLGATSQLALCTAYTGSNSPTAISGQTFSVGFTLAAGVDYLMEWIKEGRKYTLRLQELNGPGFFEVSRTATPWGYSVYPSHGYDQGAMHGAPGMRWESGGGTGPTLVSYRHWLPGNRYPRVAIWGDSITEGFGVTDAQSYAQLIADEFPDGEAHISGIGGATATSALQRVIDECGGGLRPAVAVLNFGTNGDPAIATSLPAMISHLKGLGCRVVCCTPANNATEAGIILSQPVDIVRLDRAWTVSGAGSTRVEAYYTNQDAVGTTYEDGLHPNVLGNRRGELRFKADVPWLMPGRTP